MALQQFKLQHFMKVHKALKLSNVKKIWSAVEYFLKYEAVQRALGQSCESIKGEKAEDKSCQEINDDCDGS